MYFDPSWQEADMSSIEQALYMYISDEPIGSSLLICPPSKASKLRNCIK